jgi:hypothetical protein
MDPYMRPSQRRRVAPPRTWMQLFVSGAGWLVGAIVIGWLLVQCYTKLLSPYWTHWTATSEMYREGVDTLMDPSSPCSGTTEEKLLLRIKLKGHFIDCAGAERAAQMWPAWAAFGRLMDDFDFCPGGTCIQFRFDTLSSLGLLFMLMVGVLALLLVCAVGMFCRNAYHSLAGKHDLPFAALGKATYPPPITHAYNFNAPRNKAE